ncbi:Rv1355c family protein [Dyadobacter sp. CY323]|uniref:Rv1355c family protein n=1 Tax=Dyadobacter sp. CY323 TaxID=2907302 RepID=UPI001F030846|nr:Rv1355c family protein [Dyadobacter sp. CY323]MCE6989502.1 Rv1355c family protein [Dyadobacter sp. CY323]
MYQETSLNNTYKPVFISKEQYANRQNFDSFMEGFKDKVVLDLYASQKKELIKIRNPERKLKSAQIESLYQEWIEDKTPDFEGTWVFYPWLGKVLHIVDESEFIELRTSRNQYKITLEEQQSLARKSIGIIGLSVGHAVAVSIAMERACGKLKLADFDTIELSNLNRIKTGLHNIGVNKCIVTAREIAEIDPFLVIECYTDGITKENMAGFLLDGGKLDILIDECDELSIKIGCRVMARSHQMPVVMETSDRGMLDVERFDLEPDRPIFHGMLEGIPFEKFENVSDQDRLQLVMKIVDAANVSKRGQLSLVEVGQTIGTWPQLASAVTLGAGVVTDVCRRILLNQYTESGRYYIDIESLVGNKLKKAENPAPINPYQPFDVREAIQIADSLTVHDSIAIDERILQEIVTAACLAPSTGNDQPWKWLYKNNCLHLFHDRYRSYSFGDFDQIASNLSFGAAYENLILKSNEAGFSVKANLFPLGEESILIACISFLPQHHAAETEPVYAPGLAAQIEERCTNRNPSKAVAIPAIEIDDLKKAGESIDGARFYFFESEQMMAIADIIGECDRVRLLNPIGHYDFVNREMKWSPADAERDKDGIDIRTLGMDSSQMTALSIIKDEEIIRSLRTIDGAHALVEVARKSMETASGIGMITMPAYSYTDFFRGGMAMERLWLQAEELGYAVHPQISPFYLFPRITHGQNAGLDDGEVTKLKELRKRFLQIVPLEDNIAEVFLFKIASAPKPEIKSYRLPLEETLFIVNP